MGCAIRGVFFFLCRGPHRRREIRLGDRGRERIGWRDVWDSRDATRYGCRVVLFALRCSLILCLVMVVVIVMVMAMVVVLIAVVVLPFGPWSF